MSPDIVLTYTATHALLNAARLNEIVTLTIDASRNDAPLAFVDGRTQFSLRGLRKATTIYGRWYRGTINTPYITSAQRLQWREFFESTAEEEHFTLEHPDYPGWDADVDSLTVYRPLNTGLMPRLDISDEYSGVIEWRQIING